MMTRASHKTLVIGLGNSLSRDDAFGPLVLRRLVQEGRAQRLGADLVDAGTDLLGLIEQFPQYSRIILVDAVLDAEGKIGRSGTVAALDEKRFLGWPENSPSVHQISPLVAVRLFRRLYPDVRTQITLVAYITDRISLLPPGDDTTDSAVMAGVALVMSLLGESSR